MPDDKPDKPDSTMEQAKANVKQALIPQIVRGAQEVAPTAGAAQVAALVQARFVMAFQKPRNPDQVRTEILKECRRPNFALEAEGHEGEGNSALYRRPVGGGAIAEGLGIRFAEVAERCMGNLMTGALTISEDEKKKTKYCFVLDLETNSSWEDTVDISKTVERQQPRRGDEVLSQRINSQGQITYTIAASEDALATKEGALISKKLRTLILRLVPGDLQDECIREIKRMRREKITEDPDAAKKRIIDGMGLQNVTVTMLEDYLEHPVAQCTPAEILNLQGLYGALRDGVTTWKEVMENVEESRKMKPKVTQPPPADKGMDAAKTQAPPPVQPTPPPAAPVQPTPPPTQAETQAVAQQKAPTPATPPAAQEPAVGTQPPPAWANEQPAQPPPPLEPQAPPPPAPTPAPTTTAPWRQEPIGPNGEMIWVLAVDYKGGKGKILKDVQFPAVLTKDSEAESWNSEQLARAQAGLTKVNAALGRKFVLESTIKSWFATEMDKMSSQAMECLIQVLENWK